MSCIICSKSIRNCLEAKCIGGCQGSAHATCVANCDKDSDINLSSSMIMNYICDNCDTQALNRSQKTIRSPISITNAGTPIKQTLSASVNEILCVVKSLQCDMASVKQDIMHMGSTLERLTGLESKFHELVAENSTLKQDICTVKSDVEFLRQTNIFLEERVNKAEIYSRCRNVIVSGVPQTDDEDLIEMVHSIFSAIGATNVRIDEAHRLSHKRKNSGIIVVLRAHGEQKSVIRLMRQLKKNLLVRDVFGHTVAQLLPKDSHGKISIFEHLTPKNSELFQKLRQHKNTLKIHKCYTRDGIVCFRREGEGTQEEKCICISQLERMIQEASAP